MRHTRNSGEAARGPSAGPPPERISVSMRNALLLRRPRGAGPVAQWLELAAHNRLVGGSSPPGPTILSRSKPWSRDVRWWDILVRHLIVFVPSYLARSRHGVFYFRWPAACCTSSATPSIDAQAIAPDT